MLEGCKAAGEMQGHLKKAEPVLYSGLRELHAVEDGTKDESSRDVGNGAGHDGGSVS